MSNPSLIVQDGKSPASKKLEVCLFSSLNTLRNEIKEIDDNIVQLIANRIDIVRDIGKIKLQLDLQIKNKNVEQAKLTRLNELAVEKNISPNLIKTIFSLIFNYSIHIQEAESNIGNNQLDWAIIPNKIISKEVSLSAGTDAS